MHSIFLSAKEAERFGLDATRNWVAFYTLQPVSIVKDAVGDVVLTYPIGAQDTNGELLSDYQILGRVVPVRIEETNDSGKYPPMANTSVTIRGTVVPVRYFV